MGQNNSQQEVSASARYVRISAQKARLICDGVRGMKLEQALYWLEYTPKKASGIVKKLLKSAIANAENNNGLDVDDLYLKTIYANEAPQLKRFAARAKGRGNRIIKRSSHITVVVATNNRETK